MFAGMPDMLMSVYFGIFLLFFISLGGDFMAMESIVRARCGQAHLEKLERLKNATGLDTGALLRRMIETTEIQPAVFNVNFSKNANSDTYPDQGSGVAVVG